MNVVAFRRKPLQGAWSETELATLADTINIGRRGEEWETGITENGDAQLYLLGPLPERLRCAGRDGGLSHGLSWCGVRFVIRFMTRSNP
jgi:hypothetical protein